MRGDQRIGVLRSGRGNLWHIGIASMSTRAANPKVSGRAARTQIVSQHSHPLSANTPPKIEKKVGFRDSRILGFGSSIIALRRRHIPAAEVSEASEFYSSASGEPSGSQTTPPNLIDSSISQDTLSAHEGIMKGRLRTIQTSGSGHGPARLCAPSNALRSHVAHRLGAPLDGAKRLRSEPCTPPAGAWRGFNFSRSSSH